MINTLKTIMLLRMTVKTNSMISWLRRIPLIKKIITEDFYKYSGIKTFVTVIKWIREFMSLFIWKILYFLCLYAVAYMYGNYDFVSVGKAYLVILLLFPIVGMFYNNKFLESDEESYYAIFLLKMNARDYALSQYAFETIKYFVGNLVVASAAFGLMHTFDEHFQGIPYYVYFAYVVYSTFIKWIWSAIQMKIRSLRPADKKINKILSAVSVLITCIVVVLATLLNLILADLLPSDGAMKIIIAGAALASALLFIPSLIYLKNFQKYPRIYKTLLDPDAFILKRNKGKENAQLKQAQKSLTIDKDAATAAITSTKSGYSFFNELFVKRHRKILIQPALVEVGIAVFGTVILSVLMLFMIPSLKKLLHDALLQFMPVFLFVMYALNSGKKTTEAMFINCDVAMLNYRFYRQPKTILKLFTDRLIYLIYVNVLPALALAAGLDIVFYISGGSDSILDYVVIFVSIIAMSIFFSTHNMILYYVFQPYTSDSKVKNPVYSIAHMATYMVCYFAMMNLRASIIMFCSVMIVFSILYVIVALVVAYRVAPKTFKLRK